MDDQVFWVAHFILEQLDRLRPNIVSELIEIFVLIHLIYTQDKVQVQLDRDFRVGWLDHFDQQFNLVQNLLELLAIRTHSLHRSHQPE